MTRPKMLSNLFWIKIVTIILFMGVSIGYMGYKRSKAPAAVLLSEIVDHNEQLIKRVTKVETRLTTVEHRLSRMESVVNDPSATISQGAGKHK